MVNQMTSQQPFSWEKRTSCQLWQTLLRLFGTIPVSNATAERSFSALKRLKTYLRSTMGEERLTGLALLHVNKSTEVDPDDIIELYASKKERQIRLLWFCECVICEYIKCLRISCHSLTCSTFISTLNQLHSMLLFIITSSRNISLFQFFISFEN